jgi:predicted site-specific integrase-resolvase
MKHYTAQELATLKGVSYTRVSHDLNEGNLGGYRDKKGRWLIPEPIAHEYINRKHKRYKYDQQIEELDLLLKQVEDNSIDN